MNIGIASEKGGVGKTTTALHLAYFLAHTNVETVLFDGDRTRIATNWEKRGRVKGYSIPFHVLPIEAAAMRSGDYTHRVIDTGQQPGDKDLLALAQYSDVLIVPTAPAAFDVDGLGQTIRALRTIEKPDGSPVQFRVLFTQVAHHHSKQVADIRDTLRRGCVDVFETFIPELKAFERAAERGVLVKDVDDDPRAAAAWQAYEDIGKELLDVTR